MTDQFSHERGVGLEGHIFGWLESQRPETRQVLEQRGVREKGSLVGGVMAVEPCLVHGLNQRVHDGCRAMLISWVE